MCLRCMRRDAKQNHSMRDEIRELTAAVYSLRAELSRHQRESEEAQRKLQHQIRILQGRPAYNDPHSAAPNSLPTRQNHAHNYAELEQPFGDRHDTSLSRSLYVPGDASHYGSSVKRLPVDPAAELEQKHAEREHLRRTGHTLEQARQYAYMEQQLFGYVSSKPGPLHGSIQMNGAEVQRQSTDISTLKHRELPPAKTSTPSMPATKPSALKRFMRRSIFKDAAAVNAPAALDASNVSSMTSPASRQSMVMPLDISNGEKGHWGASKIQHQVSQAEWKEVGGPSVGTTPTKGTTRPPQHSTTGQWNGMKPLPLVIAEHMSSVGQQVYLPNDNSLAQQEWTARWV